MDPGVVRRAQAPAIGAAQHQRAASDGWSRLAQQALLRGRATALTWLGASAYLALVALRVAVEYIGRVEFRSPARPAILVPYLVLFFGAILLMGLPMFRIDRRLWLVTVATTALLLASMGAALRAGVG